MLLCVTHAPYHLSGAASCAASHTTTSVYQVLLRVLDVGGARVLTSVIGQSAALTFYEE
jgi:hypothetical protein